MKPAALSDHYLDGIAAQQTAADPTHSVWVGANAGTGKTRVLIDRILRLLLTGVPSSKILCLTFTKAAAAEMANRLNAELAAWAMASGADLAARLEALTGEAPEEPALKTARKLFARTLDTPGGLKIRTIHSFCESLLGRFPIESGIAPHFSVIDERAAAELRLEARDRLLVEAADSGSDLADAFARLAGLVDESGFAGVMEQLDFHRHHLERLLAAHGGVDGAIAALRENLDLGENDTLETLLAGDAGLDEDALRRAADVLAEGGEAERKRAAVIIDWLEAGAERPRRFASLENVFLTKDGRAKVEKNLITKPLKEAHPAALAALLEAQERFLEIDRRRKAARIVAATEVLLRIGAALMAVYGELKSRRSLLDYHDLILKARDLLAGDRISWVHYKLDGGIDHVLVDEAQDTSPEQWQVIAALTGEYFAGVGAWESEGPPRSVFAVGDQKQSIYSFQGADPAKFSEMRDEFETGAAAAGGELKKVDLALSFRSVSAVLDTVDAVFARPDTADGLTAAGEAVSHLTHRLGQAGRIELWPPFEPEEQAEDDPWDAPLDQMPAKSPLVRLAETIAETIDGWIRTEMLDSAGRTVEPGDILILLRTRGQFAEEMVRQLKQRNIAVAGSDRMVLMDQIAVMDLVAAARFALLPEDDLTTAVVLKSPLVGLTEDDLFSLAHGRDGSLWNVLRRRRDETESFRTAVERMTGWLAAADFTPPYEFFSDLLGPGGGRRRLLARLGPDAADPIDEFLALALDYERDHAPGLEGFLHWLETGEVQIKRDLEHGRGEVRVMTVHGAKGLQANIVFLPDTCTLPDARRDSRLYWQEGEAPLVYWPVVKENEEAVCSELGEERRRRALQEYRRLLYVALTRARDRIYVAGWLGKRNRPEGCWHELLETALAETEATPFETSWETSGLRLVTAQTAEPDGAGRAKPVTEAETELPAWVSQEPLPEPAPPVPLTPSRPTLEDPPVISPLAPGDGERFRRGLLIHALLQSLPALEDDDRDAAALAYLARPGCGVSEAEAEAIATETLAVLRDPEFADLFGPGSAAEVAVAGCIGSGQDAPILSGQIDRLVISDDVVSVVDYKTNRPPPVRESDVPPAYLGQMAAYRAALRDIFPGRQIRAVLVWTDGPRAMRLTDELLDRYAP